LAVGVAMPFVIGTDLAHLSANCVVAACSHRAMDIVDL